MAFAAAMLAWTVDPDSAGGLALRETDDPRPLPHEVLVRVDAFAPNPGDLAALVGAPPGWVPGWDGSGVVLRAAADGQGPREGQPVLFLGDAGGWAEQRAVPRTMTATAPEGVPTDRLATLPVPATSALRAVRRLGSVLGRRVLVVGASSAVGRTAVQLAVRSGAWVVAVARDVERHEEIAGLGAHEVHARLSTVRHGFHGAIDVVGGQALVDAYALLEGGGTVVALGHAAGADEHFPAGAFGADPSTAGRTITTFHLGAEGGLTSELGFLAQELHARRLDVGAVDTRPWQQLPGWVRDGAPRRQGRVVFLPHQRPRRSE